MYQLIVVVVVVVVVFVNFVGSGGADGCSAMIHVRRSVLWFTPSPFRTQISPPPVVKNDGVSHLMKAHTQ